MTTAAPPLADLREQVRAFLTEEADMMDRYRYDDWLALWSTEGIYWVPCNEDDYDPAKHVSIVYDDYERLQERCFRLNGDAAHSQDPPSRLCRIVGMAGVDAQRAAVGWYLLDIEQPQAVMGKHLFHRIER